jgi:uncharacterized protein (TIGR00730 family)
VPVYNGFMTSVCIFCAASNVIDPRYLKLGAEMGRYGAARGWKLVYGGARGGMMGAMANAALEAGAEVTGVIPEVLGPQERAHPGLTRLHVVADMHERQRLMMDLSDGFVILPAGLGTMAEFFEVLTWKAIGLHGKKIAIVNTDGFWDPLLAQIDHCAQGRFLHADPLALFRVFDIIEDIGGFFDN